MKSDLEVRQYFENDLKSILLPLEKYRKKKINKLKLTGYAIAALISSFFILLLIQNPYPFIPLFVALILVGYATQILQTTNKTLRHFFKKDVLQIFMSYLFDDFEYIPRQRIAKSVFEKSCLIAYNISRVEGEDYMRFNIGESNIAFCETSVYGYSSNYNTIFKGIFISVSFHKKFTSQTIVIAKKLSILARNYQHILRLQRVKLEDLEFEKEFMVFSSDQVESRYILTPGLMQRILDYKRKSAKDISFSFISNRMYCIIPNQINLFEPALFESFLNFDFMQKSYYTLMLCTNIISDLNLNLRIWTKD